MSITEWLGFITGAIAVWYCVKENVWNWPWGILNSFFWFFLFWGQTLYFNSLLQIFYIVLAVFGWYWWLHGGEARSKSVIRRTTRNEWIVLGSIIVVSTALLTYYEHKLTGSVAPFWDASTTVVSVVAQYMLAKKMFENWFLWMSVDVVYFFLYLNLGLVLTASLQIAFFAMCVMGVIQWYRTLHPINRLEMVMS